MHPVGRNSLPPSSPPPQHSPPNGIVLLFQKMIRGIITLWISCQKFICRKFKVLFNEQTKTTFVAERFFNSAPSQPGMVVSPKGTEIRFGKGKTCAFIETVNNKGEPVHFDIITNAQGTTIKRFNAHYDPKNGFGGAPSKSVLQNDPLLQWALGHIQNVQEGATLPKKSLILTHPLTHPTLGEYVPFYKGGPTAFLGNFHICPNGVQMRGHTFTNSEAAFQCEKFLQILENPKHKDLLPQLPSADKLLRAFAACKDGEEAFQLKLRLEVKEIRSFYPATRGFHGLYADNWLEGGRDAAMMAILRSKFDRNPELLQQLKATGKSFLLEHNEKPRDTYWSDNSDGTGYNMLGQMLMSIRDGSPLPHWRPNLAQGTPAPVTEEQNKVRELARAFNANPQQYGVSIY